MSRVCPTACAHVFYKAGAKLILCARRVDQLERVKTELQQLKIAVSECLMNNELRHFALRFIHSHSDTTGVFRNVLCEIVVLTTSSNCVRHIVSSQDDAVAGLLGR